MFRPPPRPPLAYSPAIAAAVMSGVRQPIRSPPTPFRPFTPLSQLLSSSLPSPSELFTTFAKKPPTVATAKDDTERVLHASLEPFTNDDSSRPLVLPKTDGCRIKSTTNGGLEVKPKCKGRPRKKAVVKDDNVGLRSKYFTKQTKAGKEVPTANDVCGDNTVSSALSNLQAPPPPPRADWTPVKNTAATIDLTSSPPEEIKSFSERLEQLRCSRESSSAGMDRAEPLTQRLVSTTKRSLEVVGLPNAHRAPKRGVRKPRNKSLSDAPSGSIDELFRTGAKIGGRKTKDPAPPKKKRKSDEGMTTLLNPTTAQSRFTEQRFLFGTSSQLEKGYLQSSRGEDSGETEASTTAGKTLKALRTATYVRKAPGGGLWDEGKDIDPEVLESQAELNHGTSNMGLEAVCRPSTSTGTSHLSIGCSFSGMPAHPQTSATNSSLNKSNMSLSLPVKETSKAVLQSSIIHIKRNNELPISELVSTNTGAICSDSSGLTMPDFSTFTTAQLQVQISQYGIKKMTSRPAMIKRLQACWLALHPPPGDVAAEHQIQPQLPQSRNKRAESAAPRAKATVIESIDPNFITKAIRMAANMPNVATSFYHRILMYDPIILEELTNWLNHSGLKAVGAGEDAEVKLADVKLWCDTNSICSLLKDTQKGLERKRF